MKKIIGTILMLPAGIFGLGVLITGIIGLYTALKLSFADPWGTLSFIGIFSSVFGFILFNWDEIKKEAKKEKNEP